MNSTMRTAYSTAATDPVTSATTAPTAVVAPLVKPEPTFYEKNKDQIMWGVGIVAVLAGLWLAKKYIFKA